GNVSYPCRYNSSAMVIGGGRAAFVWDKFDKRPQHYMDKHQRYGDQAAIEELYPDAAILHHRVPKAFFHNYPHLPMAKPKGASVVNCGGGRKPHNCPIPWVIEQWV